MLVLILIDDGDDNADDADDDVEYGDWCAVQYNRPSLCRHVSYVSSWQIGEWSSLAGGWMSSRQSSSPAREPSSTTTSTPSLRSLSRGARKFPPSNSILMFLFRQLSKRSLLFLSCVLTANKIYALIFWSLLVVDHWNSVVCKIY